MYTAELGWLYGMACLLRLADRTCLLVWASSLASVQMGSGHCVVVSTAQAGNFVSGRLGDLANCCHKGSLFFFFLIIIVIFLTPLFAEERYAKAPQNGKTARCIL